MPFIVTPSPSFPDFYVVDRVPEGVVVPKRALLNIARESDYDSVGCFTTSSTATRHNNTQENTADSIHILGDVQLLEDLMRGSSVLGKRDSFVEDNTEEGDDQPVAPRKRRNAISTFFDGIFSG